MLSWRRVSVSGKPFFGRKCLISTDSLSIHGVSRPAGLLPFFEKVQLTSVGIFLPKFQEALRYGV